MIVAPEPVALAEDRAWRDAIVAWRTEGRWNEYGPESHFGMRDAYEWDSGGCGWMSEWVAEAFGWQEQGGCYRTFRGHVDHFWNILPDGRIIDVTADQWTKFGFALFEGDIPDDGIRIVAGDDERYDSECTCENQIG